MMKRKLWVKILASSLFSFLSFSTPITLSSCNKKSNDDTLGEIKNWKNFFNDVIKNSSYSFSFDKNSYSSFNLKNDYSISIKCEKNEIDKFQKQQKFFLKIDCLKEFYAKKIGTIFCLPLITKIDDKAINEDIKEHQRDLFKPIITINNKKDNDEIKEIVIEFSKKKIEKINKIKNFDIGQKDYEIIFIISIFSKSLFFENLKELEEQKNNIGAKNANIFLHLKLKKSIN